jgi:hypothetical protein
VADFQGGNGMPLRSFVIAFLGLALCWAGSVNSAIAQGSAKPAKAERMVRVTYPVADLVMPIAGFPAGGKKEVDASTLLQIIEKTVSPKSWEKAGGSGSVQFFPMGMALVVYQSADVQDEIASLLANLRRHADVQVSVEMRAVQVSASMAKHLLLEMDEHGRAFNESRTRAVSMDAKHLVAILKLAQTENETSITHAPKPTLFNAQRAQIVSDAFAYDILPVLGPDQDSVRLTLSVQHKDKAVTKAAGTFTFTPERTLVWHLGEATKGRHRFILVTPRVIAAEELLPMPRVGGTEEQAIPEGKKADQLVRKVYPIGDMVKSMVQFTAPTKNEQEAVASIREIILYVAHKKSGNSNIQYCPAEKELVVFQTNEEHEEIELALATLRKLYAISVDIDSRVVLISGKTAKQFRKTLAQQGKSVDVIDGEKSAALVSIDDAQLWELLKLAQTDRVAHVMQAPKSSFLNGQSLKVGVSESMPWGIQFDYQPVVSPDRRSVRVAMTFAQWTTADAVKRITRSAKTFNLPDGRTLAWDFGEIADRQHMFLFVSPQVRVQQKEERIFLGELPPIPR